MHRNVTRTVGRFRATQRCLSNAVEVNKVINALVHINETQYSTPRTGPLSGLRIAVKDNIVTRDAPTTCASSVLKNFISPFDATVVERIREHGAELVGKANCDEFGMGSLNTYSIHGPVINPFSLKLPDNVQKEERSAGGSSGGSAAAVAAGLCDAALGTDTGGSIRLPASYCGVVGLKPSYGLVSRWGVVSYADSLDCVGVLAKDMDTTTSVFTRISAFDTKDPTSALPSTRTLASSLSSERLSALAASLSQGRLDGLTIGIPQEFFPAELSAPVQARFRECVSFLKSKGAALVPVSLPSTAYSLSAYYVLASAEASSNMARYDGIQYGERTASNDVSDLKNVAGVYSRTRSAHFGAEVQRRILLGTYALTADAYDNYFLQAQRVRQLIKDDFDNTFVMPNVQFSQTPPQPLQPNSMPGEPKVDVLLHPSAIGIAPLLTQAKTPTSSLDAYVQDILTVPASLAGLPALSVPCPPLSSSPGSPVRQAEEVQGEGEVEWPIGVSVVGQWGSEALVLAVGKVLEDGSKA